MKEYEMVISVLGGIEKLPKHLCAAVGRLHCYRFHHRSTRLHLRDATRRHSAHCSPKIWRGASRSKRSYQRASRDEVFVRIAATWSSKSAACRSSALDSLPPTVA